MHSVRNVLNVRINCLQLFRQISYRITEDGEKVAVETVTNRAPKREHWQQVWAMGQESETIQIKRIEANERMESDPRVARQTASNKLHSLKERLMNRGFCRERKSYDPPEDVNIRLKNVCSEAIANFKESIDWKNIVLNDPLLKFRLLTKCAKEFNYEIPNSLLYTIVKVKDVIDFYSTPIRGSHSYDYLVKNSHELPKNMYVIDEPIIYNQENDHFFQGINAYPFMVWKHEVKGLRVKKMYPDFNTNFEWPDV